MSNRLKFFLTGVAVLILIVVLSDTSDEQSGTQNREQTNTSVAPRASTYTGKNKFCRDAELGIEIPTGAWKDRFDLCRQWQKEKNRGEIPSLSEVRSIVGVWRGECKAAGISGCETKFSYLEHCWSQQTKPWSTCLQQSKQQADQVIKLEQELNDGTREVFKQYLEKQGGTCSESSDFHDDGSVWFYLTCDGQRWKWDGNTKHRFHKV